MLVTPRQVLHTYQANQHSKNFLLTIQLQGSPHGRCRTIGLIMSIVMQICYPTLVKLPTHTLNEALINPFDIFKLALLHFCDTNL